MHVCNVKKLVACVAERLTFTQEPSCKKTWTLVFLLIDQVVN
ncbi:hypothetical protein VO64_4128 [Pseudomonas synxantha]|uniref:Uncharacterized protein n=1 Tax=Pseudomonas synxantha TaxID=47883 RepID=A0AAU8TSG4_9PSED|nr:hypothetical protein VO64_4128 [Pseudomonas synxantha]